MPKHVAEKTRQLSVRVDDQDLAHIDQIREVMLQKTSIRPQRSDVVRLALHYGIDEYRRKHEIDDSAIKAAPTPVPVAHKGGKKKKAS